MHTVIVGGGFAGVKAALELSKRQTGKITLISEKSYFLYHAALYATATGSSPDESVVELADIFARNNDIEVVVDTVTALDPERKSVVCKKHRYTYDTLILALGSVTSFLDIPGIQDRTFTIKTLEEIARFHAHLKDVIVRDHRLDKNYVVVGGGASGVELAGVLAPYLEYLAKKHMARRTKVRITLVEACDRLLPGMSKSAGAVAKKRLEQLGVKVILNKRVTSFDKTHITLEDRKIPTKTVVWTAGAANHPFFFEHRQYFDVAQNKRIVVNPYLEAYRDVYVLGDNADTPDSGTAHAALNMGRFIAAHLERKLMGRPLFPYRPRNFTYTIPIGEGWAYAERWGVYATGPIGHWIRRRFELGGYRQILPEIQARAAWNAHDIKYDENKDLLKP